MLRWESMVLGAKRSHINNNYWSLDTINKEIIAIKSSDTSK